MQLTNNYGPAITNETNVTVVETDNIIAYFLLISSAVVHGG